MKKILLISDLHLDETSKNEYRWDIFNQIEEKIQEKNINAVYILGDLTDKKDCHSAKFTNKLIYKIQNLTDQVGNLTILAGNHDYVDQNNPFFQFLDEIRTDNFLTTISGGITERQNDEIFLPHVKNPEETYKEINFDNYNICFTHLDVKAAKLENGMKDMKGLPLSFFQNILTFSGHIHVGQKIGGNFHYIGSPYSIIYEREDILHRGIILTYAANKSISFEDTYFNFPRKIVKKINSKNDINNLNKKNLYKFDVELSKSELENFNDIKNKFSVDDNVKLNLKLKSENNKVSNVNKNDFFKSYCKSNELNDNLIKIGKELML